jgi:hypothetical protein
MRAHEEKPTPRPIFRRPRLDMRGSFPLMARGRSKPAHPGGGSAAGSDTLYAQLLLFPERAEYLPHARYSNYRLQLDHWRDLSSVFQRAFQSVYERQSASVLLVHGDQGTGKTAFTHKLAADFAESRRRVQLPDRENLWHVLTGGALLDLRTIQEATNSTAVTVLAPKADWLSEARVAARADTHRMRVFVIDDFHKDLFLGEWAGLNRSQYLQLKTTARPALLEAVAQQLVEDCRGDFARSLFVLLSADQQIVGELKDHLDRSHRGLAQTLKLPLPEPEAKEQIVRTNVNRLNQRSYWYCLDQGGPEEKKQAFETLKGPGGFIDSFRAIDRALSSGDADYRTGRPANKNLITFVTLGSNLDDVGAFLEDHEMKASDGFTGTHLRTWLFRKSWASLLANADQEYVRAAALVESEFALRWVALDPRATWALCAEASPKALTDLLVASIREAPSIADRGATKQASQTADHALASLPNADEVEAFMTRLREGAQGRSRAYEPVLAKHFGAYSRGLAVWGSLRPDVIFEEYRPCAVTKASASDPNAIGEAIKKAIRRECHVAEFTAHMQSDLRGLAEYLCKKVLSYAELLQSV